MSEFKGVRGPYRVSEERRSDGSVYSFDVRGPKSKEQYFGPIVAHVSFTSEPDNCHIHGEDMARATARLLAAAPDLLDALQGLLALSNDGCTGAWDIAKAAIAKALGEQ